MSQLSYTKRYNYLDCNPNCHLNNKPAKRSCIICDCVFDSPGPHIRRCPNCSHRTVNMYQDSDAYHLPYIYKFSRATSRKDRSE